MQDARLADRHNVIVAREAVRAVPICLANSACGLAIAIGQHLVLREHLDILRAQRAFEGTAVSLDEEPGEREAYGRNVRPAWAQLRPVPSAKARGSILDVRNVGGSLRGRRWAPPEDIRDSRELWG